MSFRDQLRAIAQESYNKRQELMMLFTALVISLLAGFVIRYNMFGVYENAKIGFFIVVCCAMWMGMFDSILCICDKRDVLERDKYSGLHPILYILAVVVFQLLHALLQTAVMCAVTGILIEWPADTAAIIWPAPVEYFVTIFLITFAAQMLGLAVSALMKTSEHALTFAPFLLIYELIMSETIFGLPEKFEFLRDTTIVRWGLNSLGTIYNIDALPWRAEGKTTEIVDDVARQAGDWLSGVFPGMDTSSVTNAISSYTLDPSVMGVNHDLPEYAATVANLSGMWAALLLLAAVGIVVAIVGFCRRVESR